jgi:hypothetical protein
MTNKCDVYPSLSITFTIQHPTSHIQQFQEALKKKEFKMSESKEMVIILTGASRGK